MTDKPKSKVEDIARRRKWMGRLTLYLILVLIGLISIVLDHDDPTGTFVATLSCLPSISVAFVMGLLLREIVPPASGMMSSDKNPIVIFFSAGAGIIVLALVGGFLERLLGRLPW